MAISIIQPKTKVVGHSGKRGGAGMGQKIGALVGGAVGSAGGPGGAIAGASAGASVGGLVGDAIDPAKRDTRRAIEQRVAQIGNNQNFDPQLQMRRAIDALKKINNPELIQEYAPVLAQGLIKYAGEV